MICGPRALSVRACRSEIMNGEGSIAARLSPRVMPPYGRIRSLAMLKDIFRCRRLSPGD